MIKTTKLRYLVIVFSLLVLGACASAERRPAPSVSPENRAGLVLVEISQHEIDVDKPNVGNGGGGLIGALIETAAESYMDKNRQAAIAPIRDALIDVDFAEQALSKLNGRIHAGLVREDAKFQMVRGEPEADRVLLDYNDQNIMLINLRYGFEQDFRALLRACVGRIWRLRQRAGQERQPSHERKQGQERSAQLGSV